MTAMLPFSQVATAGEVNISGWVNEEMFYFDNGDNADIVATEANGTTLGTRIAFTGTQELPNSGLTAGFDLSFEPGNVLGSGNGFSPLVSGQTIGDANQFGADVGVLASNLFISGGFGKLTLGTQSMPTDNIGVLSDPSLTLWSGVSPVFRGGGMTIAGLGAGASNSTFASFLRCVTSDLGIGFDCNGVYRTGIRYDLPAFMGVKIAVGYANDDIYDISLNHSGSIAGLNTVIGIGYAVNQGGGGAVVGANETEVFQVQGGLMDPGTGIFGSVAYMNDDGDGAPAGVGDDVDSYFIKVGVKRAFNSLGDTAIAFKYGSYNDMYGSANVATAAAASVTTSSATLAASQVLTQTGATTTAATSFAAGGVTGSEVERIGFEIVQYFGAGFQIYGTWEQLDLDVDCSSLACTTAYGGADELDMFALGATYFF